MEKTFEQQVNELVGKKFKININNNKRFLYVHIKEVVPFENRSQYACIQTRCDNYEISKDCDTNMPIIITENDEFVFLYPDNTEKVKFCANHQYKLNELIEITNNEYNLISNLYKTFFDDSMWEERIKRGINIPDNPNDLIGKSFMLQHENSCMLTLLQFNIYKRREEDCGEIFDIFICDMFIICKYFGNQQLSFADNWEISISHSSKEETNFYCTKTYDRLIEIDNFEQLVKTYDKIVDVTDANSLRNSH